MLRLIKYEYRKNLPLYVILFSLVLGFGGLSLLSIASKNDVFSLLGVYLAFQGVPIVALFFFISNIITYSKELNSRAGYMAFMTPCSAFEIAGSKFITMIINATVAIGLFAGFAALDLQALSHVYEYDYDWDNIVEEIYYIGVVFGLNIQLNSIVAWFILLFLAAFAFMSLLFFAITLSRTLLENRGGRVPLAILFYVVLAVGTIVALWNLPTFSFGSTPILNFLGMWPHIVLLLIEVAGSYVGSSLFLEKKLSV